MSVSARVALAFYRRFMMGALLFAGVEPAAGGDFASVVVDYLPAPGQFVNNPLFNDPSRGLGPPIGGGTTTPDNTKLVTLGGFGGSITLGFDETVLDDPLNPRGLDAIVFSNATWVAGDPTRRFAEAATIEISRDVNGNGIADDSWFVVRSSSLPAAPADAQRAQMWDASGATLTPPEDVRWYPNAAFFPKIGASYETSAFEAPVEFAGSVLDHPGGAGAVLEAYFGYAELSPTLLLGDLSGADGGVFDNSLADLEDDAAIDPGIFYTTPDDPFVVGIDSGSGGGDAFDIAWAVDPATGASANLDGFDFIRITTAIDAINAPFGEKSAEVAAVSDVRCLPARAEDFNADGRINALDLAIVLGAWGGCAGAGLCVGDVNQDDVVNAADLALVLGAWGSYVDG